ncbi:MAG: hypothetical protein CMI54_02515 [Parcubacteria group bacterium]|nr:hypothetical protein [Parcubacteria group bacterium]|tara:strand:+ start:6669 stop:7118 length:450 start_codon:yes stop_codon:yes gene_type:complete
MIVALIVKEYLERSQFEGLQSGDGECGCDIDDLAPCGEMQQDCVPAYKKMGCPDECGMGCEYHMVQDEQKFDKETIEHYLLPCPFCGSRDLNTSYTNAIYCNACPGGVELGDHGENTEKFRNESWNNRIDDKYRRSGNCSDKETIEHYL